MGRRDKGSERHSPLVGRALSPKEVQRLSQRSRRRARRGPPSLSRDVAVLLRALKRGGPAAVAVAAVALAYLVLPADAVPDVVPLAGLADDAGVLAAAVAALRKVGR